MSSWQGTQRLPSSELSCKACPPADSLLAKECVHVGFVFLSFVSVRSYSVKRWMHIEGNACLQVAWDVHSDLEDFIAVHGDDVHLASNGHSAFIQA